MSGQEGRKRVTFRAKGKKVPVGDAKAHDVLLCVNMGKTVDDPNRMRAILEGLGSLDMRVVFPVHAALA